RGADDGRRPVPRPAHRLARRSRRDPARHQLHGSRDTVQHDAVERHLLSVTDGAAEAADLVRGPLPPPPPPTPDVKKRSMAISQHQQAPPPRARNPRMTSLVVTLVVGLISGLMVAIAAGSAHAAPTLLSQGKTATASSVTAGNAAANAVDGNTGTRWESAYADPQWLQVDLGG